MKALKYAAIVVVLFALCSMPLAAVAQQNAVSSTVVIGPEHKYALLCGTCVFEYLLQWDVPPGLGEYPCIEDYGPIPADKIVGTYQDLLIDDYGWLPDHITVQMNESNTKANIIAQITALKQYDSPESLFFILLIGHGWVGEDKGSILPGDEEAYDSGSRKGHDRWDEVFQPYDGIPGGQGEYSNLVNFISDDEFKVLLSELAFEGKIVFVFVSCCGGGILEDIQGANRLGLGVGNSDRLEMHWSPVDFYWAFALSGAKELPSYIHLEMDPDINGDGRISLEEAYCWAVAAQDATDPSVLGWGGGPSTLYMFDGIEGETFL